MASDYPRCEFPEFRTKEIQGSFTKSHSDLKRQQQKLKAFINDVLKKV
jgi:hypothetical protein